MSEAVISNNPADMQNKKNRSKLAARFRNINILFIVFVLMLMMAVSAALIYNLTDSASKDYVRFYAMESANILDLYLNKEISLIQHAAQSAEIIEWFKDEENPEKKSAAFQKMMFYSDMLQINGMYFAIRESLNEYEISSDAPFEDFFPFDTLDPETLYDQWFFEAVNSEFGFTLNLDVDKVTDTRRLWINYKVMENGKAIGILCSALQFDQVFHELFGKYDSRNVMSYIIDNEGVIQISSYIPEPDLIHSAVTIEDIEEDRHILDINSEPAFISALNKYTKNPEIYNRRLEPEVIRLSAGNYQYFSVAPIPNTNWLTVTFYSSGALFDVTSVLFPILIVISAFIIYVAASSVIIRRMLFRPLGLFTRSVSAGNNGGGIYGLERDDEIGELARVAKETFDRLSENTLSLKETAEQAKAASRSKSAFLANMSHEIRTPMNSIIGFSELALDNNIPPKTKDYLLKILENSEWLLQIINDILDISKIESGKMDLENIPFDLSEMFAACRTLIMPKAIEKGLMMHFYAEPSIGKRLYGDPVRLRQVLVNLLSNAVKFTNSGMIKVQAAVKDIRADSVTMSFEIKDSGIGITAEQMERIFDPFTQAESGTTRKYGGSGLGLPITKNIIEMMGGMLFVDSTPGVGSKFSFDVTFNAADINNESVITEINVFDDLEKPTFDGEILLCEDNAMNQQVICEHLARVGLKTTIAHNGEIGVETVRSRLNKCEKQFDLILMDIHMPVMDGLEAAAKIFEFGAGIPIVAMTANVMSNDRDIYHAIGMNGCVGKPFTSQELWRCLMKYLKPVNLQREEISQRENNDNRLRQQLINIFVESNRNKFVEIKNAIEMGDIKLAHRLTHTLKGNAGQLNKTLLLQAAEEVEDQLKNGDNIVTLQQMRKLEMELNAVITELAPMVCDSVLLAAPTELSYSAVARKLLEQLEPILKDNDPECLTFIDDLRLIQGSEELIRQIENFDFKPAMESLAELLGR